MCDADVPMSVWSPARVLCSRRPRQFTLNCKTGFARRSAERRFSRAAGPLGTDTSSNCRSEGLRAVVRSLVRNNSPGSIGSPVVSAQKTSVRRG